MKNNKALIIVDVQNDFCPGGHLTVVDGDAVVPVLNRYIKSFVSKGWPVLASRDWHPKKTKHFKTFGGPWPEHCLQETFGAMFHPDLELTNSTTILSKGMDFEGESYSAFLAVDTSGRDLETVLKEIDVSELLIGGLATDYCVKTSVLDALEKGFKVYLLEDAVRGVNLKPEDSQHAMDEMICKGAISFNFSQFEQMES